MTNHESHPQQAQTTSVSLFIMPMVKISHRNVLLNILMFVTVCLITHQIVIPWLGNCGILLKSLGFQRSDKCTCFPTPVVILRASGFSCGAVYCNRSCLCVCGLVCYQDNSKLRAGFVGKCSDHLQLIKFWPSRAPGKGVCGRREIFGSALQQPACSVYVSSEHFFI